MASRRSSHNILEEKPLSITFFWFMSRGKQTCE
jgi:hypothetical protein